MAKITYRGQRNNNPLNIRRSDDHFVGERLIQTDPDFKQFDDMEYGLRAAFRIIRTYNRKGVVSLSAIIRRWAPETENKTQAYIDTVVSRTGLKPTQPILVDNKDNLFALVIGMCWVESLYVPSFGCLNRAYELAFHSI